MTVALRLALDSSHAQVVAAAAAAACALVGASHDAPSELASMCPALDAASSVQLTALKPSHGMPALSHENVKKEAP